MNAAVEPIAAAEAARRLEAAGMAVPSAMTSAYGAGRVGVLALAGGAAWLSAPGDRDLRALLLALPDGEAIDLHTDAADALLSELLDFDAPGVRPLRALRRGTYGGPRSAPLEPEHCRRLAALAREAAREEAGWFVVEGARLVARALEDGLPIDLLATTSAFAAGPEGAPLMAAATARGVTAYQGSAGLLARATPTRPVPPAIAAVAGGALDASLCRVHPGFVALALEDVDYGENVGLCIRTADAAGADCVVVNPSCADPFGRLAVRGARGGVGRLPIRRASDLPAWLRAIAAQGVRTVALALPGSEAVLAGGLEPPCVLVAGNETRGLTAEAIAACTDVARIPMAPGQDSHNVAVSAGIALYAARRQAAGLP